MNKSEEKNLSLILFLVEHLDTDNKEIILNFNAGLLIGFVRYSFEIH